MTSQQPRLQPIPLERDVVDYIRGIFDYADRHVSTRLSRMPTSHEEWLDFSLIDSIGTARGPHITKSGTGVDVQIHFVGSGWHYERWEIADIGLIFNFRTEAKRLRTKIALLQSKRVYPIEQEFTELHGTVYPPGGLGSLMSTPLPAADPRQFSFEANSRYKALQVGDGQWNRISKFETDHGLPVHYLLYHPLDVPSIASLPAIAKIPLADVKPAVGTRVVSAAGLRSLATGKPFGHTPSFGELSTIGGVPGESLPDFIEFKILGCREGYVLGEDGEESNAGLQAVFNQRSGPIAAAIRVDIILGQG